MLIITAAGNSTRFENLGTHTPKGLLPIKGKPIIDHLIASIGQERNIIVTTFDKYDIFRNKYETIPIKSAGSAISDLLQVRNLVKQSFWWSVSDGFPSGKVNASENTVFVHHVSDPEKYNTVQLKEKSIKACGGFGRRWKEITDIRHFVPTYYQYGLCGLFRIEDPDKFFEICEKAVNSGLKDREVNNMVFNYMVGFSAQVIEWNEFNTLEDYLTWKK